MPDPLDELAGFDPGPSMNPMPPADVRRLGDRLRRRNTAVAGVGAALAVALVAAPIAGLSGDDDNRLEPAEPGLTSKVLLTADELPARKRLTEWQESVDQEGEVLACTPSPPAALDAEASVRRDFAADVAGAPAGEAPTAVVRTEVLRFADAATAEQYYDQASGWILGCPGGDDLAKKAAEANHTLDLEGGRGEVRRHDFYAPDICTECGAIRFDHMGVAVFGDRMVLVSFAEVGGPLQPEGLDATMQQLFGAAVTKAGGQITGGSSSGREESPAPPDLAGFPLAAGWPDESDNSDYRFDPPSRDNESMVTGDELTACGDTPPDTAPLDRLTARLTGPSDARVRELRLFPDTQEAVSFVAHLRNLYQSCPTSDTLGGPPTFTTTARAGSLGEESLDVRVASDGIGRSAITVVRIGDAVLVENISDEGLGAEVDALATAAHENLADVIAAMNELQDD